MLPENSIGIHIRHIYDLLTKRANADLREVDLTLSQNMVLAILSQTPNHERSVRDIEQTLHIAQPTAFGLVSRLEEKGLVESHRSEKDRRYRMIRITPEGLRKFESGSRKVQEQEMQMAQGLSKEEQAELIRLLRTVESNLSD